MPEGSELSRLLLRTWFEVLAVSLDFWKNSSPMFRRILSIAFVLVAIVIITSFGTLVPVSPEEATNIENEVNQTITSLEQIGGLVPYIFGNNLMIALIMFVPILGPIFGGYVLFNTGTVVAARATALGYPPTLTFLSLFLTPVAWLEFIAYSTAIASSVWLAVRIFQRNGKHEIVHTAEFIAIVAVLLLVGALVEAAIVIAT